MVVFAVALAGILLTYNTIIVSTVDPMVRKQAMATAESLMEEILLMPYETGGWSGTATQANRANFDDVRDYCPSPPGNCFATTGVYTINGGAPVPTLAQYNVAVNIQPFNTAPLTGNALQITVTVTGPQNIAYALTGYKINY